MAVVLQVRRGSTTDWEMFNPVLARGEIGANTDTWELKIGDGTTAWNDLIVVMDDGDMQAETAKYIEMAHRIYLEMLEQVSQGNDNVNNAFRRSDATLDENRDIISQIDDVRIQVMSAAAMPGEDDATEIERLRAWITPLFSKVEADAQAAQQAATSASQMMTQTHTDAETAKNAKTASTTSAAQAETSRVESAGSATTAAGYAATALAARDRAIQAQVAAEAARAAIEALPKYQDTGWRNITPLLQNNWNASSMMIRRAGNQVELLIQGLNPGTSDQFLPPISGMRPSPIASSRRWPVFNALGTKVELWSVAGTGALAGGRLGGLLALGAVWSISWTTVDAWPETLPGNPVT